MMIKPPRQPCRRAVLEIHDGILIAVEQFLFDKLLVWFMSQTGKRDLGLAVYLVRKEAGKDRGGCKTIKAVVMVQYSKFHLSNFSRSIYHRPCRLEKGERGKIVVSGS